MRKVVKNLDETPASLLSPECRASWLATIAQGAVFKNAADFYRGSQILVDGNPENEVVFALKKLYFFKCAYCESIEHDPQVEHYRPKGRVSRVKSAHFGYFWLVYEWSNLVPSCFDCNKVGKGKGNHFPVINEPARQRLPRQKPDGQPDFPHFLTTHPTLANERPMLLHPEIDDPKPFFSFTSKGKMSGLDADGRGKETIKICNLNRQNLLVARQGVVDGFQQYFEDAFARFYFAMNNGRPMAEAQKVLRHDFNLGFKRLAEQQDEHKPLTLLGWFLYEKFDVLVVPLFENKEHRAVLADAFQQFRACQL